MLRVYEGLGIQTFNLGKLLLLSLPVVFLLLAARSSLEGHRPGARWALVMGALVTVMVGAAYFLGVSDQQLIIWLPAILAAPVMVAVFANRGLPLKAKLGCLSFAALILLPVALVAGFALSGSHGTLTLTEEQALWDSRWGTAIVARTGIKISETAVGSKLVWDIRCGKDHFPISSRMIFRAPNGQQMSGAEVVGQIQSWSRIQRSSILKR